MQPEVFAELGLIVFHECHPLHVRKDDSSRRGLLEGSRVLKGLRCVCYAKPEIADRETQVVAQDIPEWLSAAR